MRLKLLKPNSCRLRLAVMQVIHGYIDQRNFTESGNRFSFVLIARRSRIFAGTRCLRRGINHEGYFANWVEVV